MSFSHKQEDDFFRTVVGTDIIEKCIEWINSNLDPNNVFDDQTLKDYVQSNFNPEDVFKHSELQQWADDNL
jgi:hypothetical protein